MKKTRRLWNPAEIERLYDLAGEMPLNALAASYNRWARSQGHTERTLIAIKAKLQKLALSVTPTYNNMSFYEWERTLGLSRCRISRLYREGKLVAKKAESGRCYVAAKDIARSMEENPRRWGDADLEIVESLLGEAARQAIATTDLYHGGRMSEVIDLTFGRRYSSPAEAAKQTGLCRIRIAAASRKQSEYAGRRWAYSADLSRTA